MLKRITHASIYLLFYILTATSLHAEVVEYDTHEKWEGSVNLSYVLTKNISLIGKYHSEYSWGGGINILF
jgi:hypothetical protein